MKVALVHDYLNQYGGGERVLEALMELFPDAPVYTLLYDKEKTRGRFEGKEIIPSRYNYSVVRKNHRLFIPLMPAVARSINLGDKYDLIISDTAGFAKGVRYNKKTTKHISYIHTPVRYAWETDTYFNASFDGSGIFKSSLFRNIFRPAFRYIRNFDKRSAKRPNRLLTNSHYIQKKIKTYLKKDAEVIYPPVDTKTFYYDKETPRKDYFLALGRLLHYKRFDVIVDACKEANVPLIVAGEGQELSRLKEQARGVENITFVPFQESDDEVRKLYAGARALLFANEEDFGLVMAEAQSCGTPVIAYGRGGAREIVQDTKTGLFFTEQTADSLVSALNEFERMTFNYEEIAKHAQQFSKEIFQKKIQEKIQQEMA